MTAPRNAPISRLADVVGRENVLVDDDLRASHETDWTGRFHGTCACVVRPRTTGELQAVVAMLAPEGIPIVTQGGNTGLVGGSVPRGGEVVLSTLLLDEVGSIDPLTRQVTVGAGATLAAVQRAAGEHSLRVGVDFGARDSATIGGMAAANAGGTTAVRYGSTRAQVVGLEAVLASGAVISRLRGLLKDNVGYDLPGLLVGSEGTLAVITQVRLRLLHRPRLRATALVALPGIAEAVAACGELLRAPAVEAVELMLHSGMELACEHLTRALPMADAHGAYLLVEAAGDDPQEQALAEAVAGLAGVEDALLADDAAGRASLWALREGHSVAVASTGIPPHKLDVTVAPGLLAEFIPLAERAVRALDPSLRVITYGHVGDGNMHVNVIGPAPDDERVDETVLRLVAEMGGSISAEHGIGVAKAPYLHLGRSAADIEAMRAVKHALDPTGVMNPGVIFSEVPQGSGTSCPSARGS
jgi:FAD/FMN-containing dehydrogenase